MEARSEGCRFLPIEDLLERGGEIRQVSEAASDATRELRQQ